MGKLNVLGVKRVESLIEILNDKKKREVASLDLMSKEEAENQAKREFGVVRLETERDEFIATANAIQQEINKLEGTKKKVDLVPSYSLPSYPAQVQRRRNEILEEANGEKLEELNQKYKSKEQRLWLCETLEEAKEIVGIE